MTGKNFSLVLPAHTSDKVASRKDSRNIRSSGEHNSMAAVHTLAAVRNSRLAAEHRPDPAECKQAEPSSMSAAAHKLEWFDNKSDHLPLWRTNRQKIK